KRARDHGQWSARGEALGHRLRGGAFVEEDRLDVVQELDNRVCNARLLLRTRGGANNQRTLESQTLDGDGSAVDPFDQPPLLQLVVVSSQRLWGDTQLLGRRWDLKPAIGPRGVAQPPPAFLRLHGGRRLSTCWVHTDCPRSCQL